MKIHPTKNWIARILSLLLAIAIWFLIKQNLADNGGFFEKPPRAVPVGE
jgi:YbbR domain-containing protein